MSLLSYSSWKLLLSSAVLLQLTLVGVSEAQAPAPTSPRFSSGSSLVMVPTVVTDKSGVHVTGLNKDDFTVYENDHPQKPVVFEEVTTESGKLRTVDPKDAGFTNVVSPEAHSQRLTMILIDTLNTRFQDQVRA